MIEMLAKLALLWIVCGAATVGEISVSNRVFAEEAVGSSAILSEQQWQQVDASVERGLAWLASQQQRDGSFPTLAHGQPGVTSLCVLAFMSHGHLPGEGPYGEQLQKAVGYVISCQKQNGLLAFAAPDGAKLSRNVSETVGTSSAYNHAFSGLLLSETYGLQGSSSTTEIRPAVSKAVDLTLEMQGWPKNIPEEAGGWRYLHKKRTGDSDLSITGWQLMFLRSAKNAGFDVPKQPIDDAVGSVRRCFRPESATFVYGLLPRFQNYKSRGVTGAGILALAHGGRHNLPEAQAAGDWLLKNRFDEYNVIPDELERYHYGVFTCSQAMYQLGGGHWKQFFPSTALAVVSGQQEDGSWLRESHRRDSRYGNAYTTAFCLLALGTPNDLLPIFQR